MPDRGNTNLGWPGVDRLLRLPGNTRHPHRHTDHQDRGEGEERRPRHWDLGGLGKQLADPSLQERPPLRERRRREPGTETAAGTDPDKKISVLPATVRKAPHDPMIAVELDGQAQVAIVEPQERVPGERDEQRRHGEPENAVTGPPMFLLVGQDQPLLRRFYITHPRRQDHAGAEQADDRRPGVSRPLYRLVQQRSRLPVATATAKPSGPDQSP